MNVYDKAHELVRALKESPDYKEYIKLAEIIKKDLKAQEMLIEFRKKNLDIQQRQLAGKPVDQSKIDEVQKLYDIVKLNKDINQFLVVEYRLGKTMVDVQRIIGEGVKLEFAPQENVH